jgi:hypothetical protein
MELFDQGTDPTMNILPSDGIVHYYGKIFNQNEAETYFDILLNTIAWKNDEAIIFDRKFSKKNKYVDKKFLSNLKLFCSKNIQR